MVVSFFLWYRRFFNPNYSNTSIEEVHFGFIFIKLAQLVTRTLIVQVLYADVNFYAK